MQEIVDTQALQHQHHIPHVGPLYFWNRVIFQFMLKRPSCVQPKALSGLRTPSPTRPVWKMLSDQIIRNIPLLPVRRNHQHIYFFNLTGVLFLPLLRQSVLRAHRSTRLSDKNRKGPGDQSAELLVTSGGVAASKPKSTVFTLKHTYASFSTSRTWPSRELSVPESKIRVLLIASATNHVSVSNESYYFHHNNYNHHHILTILLLLFFNVIIIMNITIIMTTMIICSHMSPILRTRGERRRVACYIRETKADEYISCRVKDPTSV